MRRLTKDNCIVLGLLVALAGGATFFVYLPQSNKAETLDAQIAAQQAALNADTQKVLVVPGMIHEVQDLKAQYQDFDRKLPKRKELGGFLKEISGNLGQERLTNQSIEPGSPTRADYFNTLPIAMKFHGSYLSLASFLKRLDGMQRLSRVQKLKVEMTPNSGGKDKDDSGVDIELLMNIYFTES